jgi:dTDP-4-dehydrorhamnose reductase
MRIVLTGRDGQVGRALTDRVVPDGAHTLTALNRSDLNICDQLATRQTIADLQPEIVINAAAYTAVDEAEEQRDQATMVNVEGPRNLALGCKAIGAALIHLSTDFVFDGQKQGAYRESDQPAPLSEYGRTKLAGEEAVRNTLERHLIIRLSWVFGPHGRNFVKTILRLASQREQLRVVADQRGCPTYTGDIAEALFGVVDRIAIPPPVAWGLYHLCGSPPVSWHSFAETIIAHAGRYGALRVREVAPISTREYPLPARRPPNSILDCHRFARQFNHVSPPWLDGLEKTLEACLGEPSWITMANGQSSS